MFNDFDAQVAAETLPLVVAAAISEQNAAARVTARHARDKDDLAELLAALGLPDDPDTVTALLPLIPDPANDTPTGPAPTGDEPAMPDQPTTPAAPAAGLNAFEAMAISMHNAGHVIPAITEATGMPQQEVEDLIAAHTETSDDTDAAAPAGEPSADHTQSEDTLGEDRISALLAWAEQHSLASIRGRAARVRSDLAELADRRTTEQATAEAEARVAKAKADLEAAQAQLRAVKTGTARPTTVAVPTPIKAAGTKRTREQLADIRAWARENGYQVGVAGVIKASVVAAYDAAHQGLAEAG